MRQKYARNEAINRILRSLEGKPPAMGYIARLA